MFSMPNFLFVILFHFQRRFNVIWPDSNISFSCNMHLHSWIMKFCTCSRACFSFEYLKRPTFPSSKQLLDVTSCLFLGIFCKQCIYLFTKKSIKTKFYMDRLNIRSAKYLFWAWKSWPLEIFKWKACSTLFKDISYLFCLPSLSRKMLIKKYSDIAYFRSGKICTFHIY